MNSFAWWQRYCGFSLKPISPLIPFVYQEHGLLRMQEVIAHEELTTYPGTISFQGCYIHILIVRAPSLPFFFFIVAHLRLLLVPDVRPSLNELAPFMHQVCLSYPVEYRLLSINFSGLYGIVHQHYDTIERTLEAGLGEIIDTRQAPSVSRNIIRIVTIPEIFRAVIGLFIEYVLHCHHGTKLTHSPGI